MSGTTRPTLAELPLRPELVGEIPYGAPQLDVAVCLNVNENPYPPSPQVVAEIAAAVAEAARGLNRYPERDAIALRADLAAYLGHGLTAEAIWAANGSNEVMLHILQAFGGPGRSVLSFTPTYSMYPEYARDTHTTWLTCPRAADFTIDPEVAVAAREGEPSRVGVAGVLGIHRVRRREGQHQPVRAGEGLQDVQHHLVAAVRRPDLVRSQPVAQITGQVGAQRHRVPLGIAVHRGRRDGDGGGDLGDHLGAGRVGILVHVEAGRDVELRRSVRHLPDELGPQGQVSERGHRRAAHRPNRRLTAAPCAGRSSASANTSTSRATSARASRE